VTCRPGVRFVVWVQGCTRGCPGCFNQAFQPADGGADISPDELTDHVLATDGIDGVTLSGGEPFEQSGALARFAEGVRAHELSVMCYTGFTLEELRASTDKDTHALLSEVDILIDGPFVSRLRAGLPWRGSSNQRVHVLSERFPMPAAGPADQVAEMRISDHDVAVTGIEGADLLDQLRGVLAHDHGIELP
jgi:anaerobic ribonucleoside-triphosphate reductase activating protein